MFLQPVRPQVRLLVPVLLRGGAHLVLVLVLHPARQPDDRQGEGLLLHALRQLLQEHHHVRQLRPQHQVLEPSPCSGTDLPDPPRLLELSCCRKCCELVLSAASVTEEASVKGSNKKEPASLFWTCPPSYLNIERPTYSTYFHTFILSFSGTTLNILELSDSQPPRFRILLRAF